MKYEKIVPTGNYPCKIFTFFTKSPDRLIPSHWHGSGELLFCISGELEVTFRNTCYSLKENDLLFINSNIVHSSRSPIPGECLAIQFPLEYLAEATEGQYGKDFIFELTPKQQSNALKELLLSIRNNFSKTSLADHLLVKSNVYRLLSELCKEHLMSVANIKEIQSVKYLEKMREVNDYILQNYHRDLGIEEVAQVFSYNTSYFSRFYKKFMGITFTEYLHSIRLEAAYKELRDTDATILDIAYNSGFSTVKSFYNVFKKNYELSPQQYRQKYFKK